MNLDPPDRLALRPEDYQRARALIEVRIGLSFGEKRYRALAQALLDGARHHNCTEISQYLDHLAATPTKSELWDQLVESLTVSETYFFRDAEQMQALRVHILPMLIRRHSTDRTLRVWSAGCATGEEPYTLAILLQQLLPDAAQWNLLILATDINKPVLRSAALAQYRPWSFRQTDNTLRDTYFTRRDDLFMLHPELRQRVTFAYLNLAEAVYPSPANQTNNLDLILCRNVMIYQPQDAWRGIVQRFDQCLAAGGWLMVGASESCPEGFTQLRPVRVGGAIVYCKAEARIGEARMAEVPSTQDILQPSEQPDISPLVDDLRPAIAPEVRSEAPAAPVSSAAADADLCTMCRQGDPIGLPGRNQDERQRLEVCLRRDSHCVNALCRMAQLEANTGRLAEARHWAEQAIESAPLHSTAHYLLALIHEELGETNQAIARFKKVIYLDPDFVLAHVHLGNLYQRIGKMEEASRHRSIAVRVAARLPPDTLLHGADGVTAGRLLDVTRDAHRVMGESK